jgi:small subunit ribosomal protein S1
VIDLDHKRRRVVLSQRVVLEEELNQKKMELLSTLQAGQIREGTIVRLADFGAFVDLGGIDGLIHNSELSWSRIKHPSEVVQIGDKVMVEVMKFDAEAKKVSLSVKHSLEDPWKTVPEQLVEGTLVPATLIKATQNYLLVELLPGVTGMVPKSEFDAAAPPAQGEQVQVRLLSINTGTRRITASMNKVSGTSSDSGEVQEYIEGQEEPTGNSIGEVVARLEETPAEEPPDTE